MSVAPAFGKYLRVNALSVVPDTQAKLPFVISDFHSMFEVNVIGLLAVTQAFLPLLRQGRGRVVNIGSALACERI
jgi:NAD(P)-dependent dehydrogenase (short-subunit alcohol dehydrogenase family)